MDLHPETAETLRLLVAFVAPLLVALVTREVASSRLKSLILTAITAAQSLGLGALDSSAFDANDALRQFGFDLAVAVAVYYGLWKPTGAAASVASATSDFGVGRPAD
jgi:hypothetical protein